MLKIDLSDLLMPTGGLSIDVGSSDGVLVPLVPGDVITWLLCDNFTTDLAAGSVNGTAAEPGPGVRTVVDTGSDIALSGGKAVFANGAGTWGQTYLAEPALVGRIAGTMLMVQDSIPATDKYHMIGFGVLADTYPNRLAVLHLISGTITFWYNTAQIIIDNFAIADYKYCLVLSANGGAVLRKTGTGNFILLYKALIGNTNNLVPFISNFDAVFTSDFIRIPTALWLPTPLLSTSGAMTWPLCNGLGHAEGVAGGIGAGGGGLTMLDAGTWSVAGGYVLNTPVLGVELYLDTTFDDTTKWDKGVGWSVAGGVATCDGSTGTNITQIKGTKHKWYSIAFDIISRTAGAIAGFEVGSGYVTPTLSSGTGIAGIFRATTDTPNIGFRSTSGGFIGTIDNATLKPLPISQLITNCQLSTTDVLCEQVIHAYPGAAGQQFTQVGMAMNLDRSFAAKAAALAASGQAILSLKEVTGVGGVGLAATDGLTVNGVSYTLTVTGAGTVAYDDVAKTQTVVLSANLAADVAADAKVGLDWAAWNGVLIYFDGAGNIKVDEVKAGVYTNRGSTAKAFAADARLIIRKIGTSYYWFYGEALITTTTAVDAAAMAGKYHGMFSTLAANTITSMVVYDTGNVTNLYANMDKYSN